MNDEKRRSFIRSRIIPLVACLIPVVACLAYGKFRQDLPDWWRLVGGGIPYVLFWILLWFIAFPYRTRIMRICVGVVAFTCLLEVLQLWNPEPLAQFRRTKFGAALLGNTFQWSDFPAYFAGGAIAFVILHCISFITGRPKRMARKSKT